MMKSTFKKIHGIFLLIILLTSGCAATIPLASPDLDIQAKKQAPSTDSCLIYIYRTSQYVGSGVLRSIVLDNDYIGELAPGCYFLVETLPGEHSISKPFAFLDPLIQINISCQPGQIYFVRLEAGFGWKFIMVDEATGRRELESNKLVKTISLTGKPKSVTLDERAEAKPRLTGETLLKKAFTAEEEGNYPEAIANLRLAMMIDTKNLQAYSQTGNILLKICDTDGAARVAKAGLELDPQDQSLLNIFDRARGKDTGVPDSSGSHNPDACRAQALNRGGVVLAREKKFSDALKKFEEATQLAPGLIPKAHYNAALTLEQLGRPREALAHYVAARKDFLLPEEELEALMQLVSLTQRARIEVPENIDRRYRIGIVRAHQKRYKEAIQEFEAAIAEAPWIVDAYLNLGLVYEFEKEYSQALRALRIYSRLAPKAQNIGTVKTKIVELEDRLGLLSKPVK